MKFFFHSHGKQDFVSLRFYHSGKGFKVVNTFMLFKTFYNSTSFISFDIIINGPLIFEGPFCC